MAEKFCLRHSHSGFILQFSCIVKFWGKVVLLYIHIPFCDSKCGYCAFFSQVNKNALVSAYFNALLKDLRHTIRHFNVVDIASVFVGGGTPNFVDSKHYIPIFTFLEPFLANDCEITFEANPNLLSESWLVEAKHIGLNRLSFGIQSFYDDKLQMLERTHRKDDISISFSIASRHIENISLDLIYDCKLDTRERVLYELESALNMPINHLSAYSLSIDSKSRFGDNNLYDLQAKESFGYILSDFLHSRNFRQYEVSNFALTNKCRHNIGYWSGAEYLGVGASAVGRVENIRYVAPANIEHYIAQPLERKCEILSQSDLNFESVFMGFRSEVGVKKGLLKQDKLYHALTNNLCREENGQIYANDFFIADSLSLYLT